MKKLTIFSVLALFVIAYAVITIPAAYADHSTASVSAPPGSAVPGCEETNECYIPADVSIDIGGEVTWTNDDTAAHTVTSGSPEGGPDGLFDSSLFMAGSTFSVKFDGFEAGDYPYFCMVHPWMVGTVTVLGEAMAEEHKDDKMMMMDDDKMMMMDDDKMMMMDDDKMMKMKTMMVGDVDVTMSPPIEGSDDASVTIIEFGDFQCPKCDQWFQNEKPAIKADYIDTGKANLYFVDFTFLGDDSNSAAEASYCADEQGMYWEYHSHLYNNQGGINEGWANPTNLKQFASDIGLDTAQFNSCLDSGKYADRVDYNKQIGISHGVEGTPVFFIVGSDGTTERIDGPQPSAIFANVIDSMLGEAMAQEMTDDSMMMMDEKEEEMTESAAMDSDTEEGGGCLIATAAYGSELAPQVQFLREVRDNTLLSTTSGATFMTGFNSLYYSFSPAVADLERENPAFRETVKLFITPMLSTLSIMTLADEGSESQVLGLGISVIALNLGMYVAAPTAAIGFAVRRHFKSKNSS